MLEYTIEENKGALVAAALHNGHNIDKGIEALMALDDAERLREEDPYTGLWTEVGNTRLIVSTSRFQLDLNRPPQKAVYLTPEDSWGLKVWSTHPDEKTLNSLYSSYTAFYESVAKTFNALLEVHKKIFVFDIHSYNHRRNGPGMPPDEPEKNPEINIGTGNVNREEWKHLVDRFIKDIASFDYNGRNLDVRENIKFKGGHFSKWLSMTYGNKVCCLAIEFKKFFMDEWTGKPDIRQVELIKEVLHSTVSGIKEELKKAGADI